MSTYVGTQKNNTRLRKAFGILLCISVCTYICIASGLFGAITAHAAINQQINYQGKLTNASNVAVADGTYNMRFWLAQSLVQATTSAVWTESLTSTNRVQVTNGLFSIMLGSTSPLTNVNFNQTLYLGVEIGGTSATPVWDGEMSPRKILGAVPAAFEALNLGGASSTQYVRADQPSTIASTTASTLLTINQFGAGAILSLLNGANSVFTALSNGSVGIGTSSPTSALSVAGNGVFSGNLQAANVTATGTLSVTGNTTLTNATTTMLGITGIAANSVLFLNANGTVTATTSLSDAYISDSITVSGATIGSNNISGTLTTTGNLTIGNGAFRIDINSSGWKVTNSVITAATWQGNVIQPAYGGTGVSATPVNGQLLIGDGLGYTLATLTAGNGIAITNASGAITINNSSTTQWTTSGANIFYNLGNVGIGSSSPNAKLSVGGNAYIGGNITATGTLAVSGTTTLSSALSVLGQTILANASSTAESTGSFAAGQTGTTTIATNGALSSPSLIVSGTETIGTSNVTNASTTFSTTTIATIRKLFDNTGSAGLNGQFLTSNGSTTLWSSTSTLAYLSSLNGLTAASQSFATTSNNGGWGWSSAGSTHTLNIPQASASQALGLLTAADWSTFNSKLASSSLASSSALAVLLSDETGTGSVVFSASPTFTGTANFGNVNVDQFSSYKQNGTTVLYASTTNTALAIGASSAAAWMAASSSIWSDIAIGSGALATTPTISGAQFNIAIGLNALTVNTQGSNNTALGVLALTANTVGSDNTALGRNALNLNKTGSNNVAVGENTLYNNVAATNTVAVGLNAAFGLGGSYSNQGITVIGNYAGSGLQTGSDYNTLIGYQSGYGITTGARNVLIGQSTIGASQNQVTTGSNNIAIGNDVAIASPTQSNQLNIGNLIYGTGLSGTGSTVSTGNIGIGTTSPYSTLHVQGQIIGGISNAVTYAAPLSKSALELNLSANSLLTLGETSAGSANPAVTFYRTAAGARTGSAYRISSYTSGAGGLAFEYPSINTAYGSEALTLGMLFSNTNGGSLGIGTDTPAAKLSIQDKSGLAGTNLLFVIGSSTPAGTGTTTLFSVSGSGTTTIANGVNIATGCFAVNGTCLATGGTNFFTNSGANTYLTTGTKLGIGTSTPFWQMQIASTTGTPYLALSNMTGATDQKHWLISQSGDNKFRIGQSNDALSSTSTKLLIDSSTDSFYVGTQVGTSTGNYNNALGFHALYANTSGSANNAMGAYALANNSSGANNNAFGTDALKYNTSGYDNNAIGNAALNINTTGFRNNALGASSLLSNTTGTDNNALGYQSLKNNTTGQYNNALGLNALLANTSGSYSSAIGQAALFNNTTGSNNNALGQNAGLTITTGTSTTFLGAFADASSGNLSTSTAIGAGAIVGCSNCMVLGGMGANYANVGIGTSTRYMSLQVASTTPYFGLTSTQNNTSIVSANFVAQGGGSIYKLFTSDPTLTSTSSILIADTAHSNLFFATEPLNLPTNGFSQGNVLLGSTAGQNMGSNANNNTFIGISAGFTNTSGSNNNFLGSSAGYSNTTGTKNNYFGLAAGANGGPSTGTDNNAFGTNALSNIISGSQNNALGLAALYSNTTGSNNNSLGYNSLYNNTSGANNNALGQNAGYTITTGTSTTFLGAFADASSGNLSTSTAIGAGAIVGCSNCLVLGGTGQNRVNVGIGTSTPYWQLQVASTTGTPYLALSNMTGGVDKKHWLLSNSGDGIFRIGQATDALTSTSTKLLVDSTRNNFYVGLQSGTSTGTDNNALGYQALLSNTTGFDNNALGNGSLFSNTTGTDNNALGYQALFSNTTGTNNNALGSAALYNNSTGVSNNAFGAQALFSNTTGFQNNALGDSALRNNIGGIDNNALGVAALRSNTFGSENNALGYQSFYSNTTGSNNLGIGQNAGYNNTTGWGNIALGERTYFSSTTASRQLNIGNILYGSLPATSTQFTLPTSGGIGIGSTSPMALLTIHANGGDTRTTLFAIGSSTAGGLATTTLFSVSNSGTTTIANGVNIATGCFAVNGTCLSSGTNFFTNSGANTYLTTGTKLGIGTSTPYWQLQVASSATPYIALTNTAGTADAKHWLISQSGDNKFRISQSDDALTTNSTRLYMDSANANFYAGVNTGTTTSGGARNTGIGEGVLSNNTSGIINTAFGWNALGGNTSGSYNNALGSSALTSNITGSDNNAFGSFALSGFGAGNKNIGVGYAAGQIPTAGNANTFLGSLSDASIGTISSSTALGVGATVGCSNCMVLGGTGANRVNVGIGTSTPFWQLQVASTTGSPYLALSNMTGTANNKHWLLSNSGDGIFRIGQATDALTSTSTKLLVDSTNNNFYVGAQVGTSTGTNNNALGASALYNNTSGAENNSLGYNSLFYNTTGLRNNAIGQQALQGSSTAFMTGSDNNAFGYQSLFRNASGQANNALGAAALYYNTSGSYNNAIGVSALQNNTTGGYNNALGFSALYSNTTGTNNNAIGQAALFSNTTGINNNAMGIYALNSNTTGSYNNAIGILALQNNVSATGTTALGYGAGFGAGGLYYNQGGTYVGYTAGFNLSSSSDYNTLVGYASGYGITTGLRNVLIGQSTIGASQNQVTTGSNNIAIGNDVAVASPTQSNQLNIGNLIYGTGLNGTGATVSSGNIGIGTSTPTYKLDVQSSVNNVARFQNNSSANASNVSILNDASNGLTQTIYGSAYVAGSYFGVGANGSALYSTGGNFGLGTIDAYPLSLATNGTEKMRVTSAGNVGIGTTSPSSQLSNNSSNRLDSSGFGIGGSSFNWQGNSSGYVAGIENLDASTVSRNGLLVKTAATDIASYVARFESGGVPRLVVRSDGNVGVGTTTPTTLLSINNLAGSAAFSSWGAAAVNTASDVLVANSLSSTFLSPQAKLQVQRSSNLGQGWNFLVANNAAGTISEAVRITSEGNVGIGTTTPGANLEINGASGGTLRLRHAGYGAWDIASIFNYTNPDLTFSIAGGAEKMRLNANGQLCVGYSGASCGSGTNSLIASGNVGIGTTTPTSLLSVAGNGVFAGNLQAANITATGTLAVTGATTLSSTLGVTGLATLSGGASTTNFSANYLAVGQTATTTLTTNGYVLTQRLGVGTVAPNWQLQVASTTGSPYLALSNMTGAVDKKHWLLSNSGDGIFRIGTSNDALTSTSTKLLVDSTNNNFYVGAQVGTSTGTDNNALGSQALNRNATGNYNNALGNSSLFFNTSGSSNNALGFQSLYNNTIGASNNALGQSALTNNTSGSSNNALGQSALANNTTGTRNNALGPQALQGSSTAFQTGTDNNALGFASLFSNTTGSNNNALGLQSLYYNTSGANNNALGYLALQGSTTVGQTGTDNNAFGQQSLSRNATGNNNNAIGNLSQFNNTSGSNNNYFGFNAGYDNTSGSQNIGIGYFTTQGVGITTGNNNILIGNDVRPQSQTASNQLNIGNLLYSQGLGTGNTLAAGNLGVGTSSPFAKFTVVSGAAANENNPLFWFATTSAITSNLQQPILWGFATTTGDLDYARVAIGTTSAFAGGIRDQLTVAGRIYSTWLSLNCVAGSSLGTTTNVNNLRIGGACGDFALDVNNDGDMEPQATYPPRVRLRAGLTTSFVANEAAYLRSTTLLAPATSSPVMETRVGIPASSQNGGNGRNYIVGWADTVFGTTTGYTTLPGNGVFFSASSTANWGAYIMRAGVPTAVINTGISTTSGQVNLNRMRIEVSSSSAIFLIDGAVVANVRPAGGMPTGPMAPMVGVYATTTFNGGAGVSDIDISYIQAWVDDPATPGGGETIAASDARQTPQDTSLNLVQNGDIAEYYQVSSTSDYVPGMLVTSRGTNRGYAARTDHTYDSTIFGTISTNAQTMLGQSDSGLVHVSLAGRAPVIVSLENGAIAQGDPITSSKIAGVGQRAGMPGQIIGHALESVSQSACDAALKTEMEKTGVVLPENACLVRILATIEPGFGIGTSDMFAEAATSTASFATLALELASSAFEQGATFTKFVTGEIAAKVAYIGQLFTNEVHTKQLCVADNNGSETCITKTQLDALLLKAGVSGSTASPTPTPPAPGSTGTGSTGGTTGGTGTSTSGGGTATSTPDTEAPTIAVIGGTTVNVDVGATYTDAGATVSDNVSSNLSYTMSLDGGAAVAPSAFALDTAVAGTHSIEYKATDAAGNAGTVIRTVVIQVPAPVVPPPTGTDTPPTP